MTRCALLLSLLLLAGAAHAESEAIDQATLDQAEQVFFEGLGHYRNGRFEEAAVAFQKAYSLTKHRDLLFNVARSRERMGDSTGAVQWYRSYLATQPADETAIIHRIKQLGGDPTAPAADPVVGEKPPKTPGGEAPTPTAGGGAGAWPWLLVGAGALAAGAGTYFGLLALDDADAARDAVDRGKAEDLKASAESSALVADVAFGVGALAIGTAVVLWLRADSAPETRSDVQVGATPTADGWRVGIGGTF